MKISEDSRFAHPVLSATTNDYRSGEFGIAFSVVESPDLGKVALEYNVTLSEPGLLALVSDDRAAVGVYVNCRETYFSNLLPLGLASQRISFPPGTLLGRVTLTPMIWARKSVAGFSLENCHEEFGEGATDFRVGEVLALGEEMRVDIGREKLAQMETIFKIAKWPELEPGTLTVNLNGSEKIQILVATDIYETINNLRGLPHGKAIVMNSVYLPAIMQILDAIRGDGAAFDGRKWFRIFDAKCTHLGINPEQPDLWKDAQKMLEAPFLSINRYATLLGS